MFYIYGSDKDVIRGQHANRKSEFVLINVAGESKVRVKSKKGIDMKTVIVTGATSMIGIATIKECIKHGVRVLAISRSDSKRRSALPDSPLLSFIGADLSELKDLVIPDDSYDVIYHFGWGHTDRSTRDNEKLQEKNIEYCIGAVELGRRYGCKRFIGAGSQAEYGFRECEITEETVCIPETAYGRAKVKACDEAIKLCSNYGIQCVWTRIFSVYGINDSPNVLVSYLVDKFINGEVASFSSGEQYWNYLYEDDAATYFYMLGKMNYPVDNLTGMILNVGSPVTKRLRDFIYEVEQEFGPDFKYEFTDKVAKGIHPNVSRLINLTGYLPKVGFGEGMKRILNEREKNSICQA